MERYKPVSPLSIAQSLVFIKQHKEVSVMEYIQPVCNGKRRASLSTAHGVIHFPTFMPVTTFGDKYPLDRMIQPYLKRLSQCLMVSYYYAQKMKRRPSMPIFVDSGGYAGLFEGTEILDYGEYACIKTKNGDEVKPLDVLHFQMKNADIGATLDFIIPPGLNETECRRRQELTIKNALYAQEHNIAGNLVLFASLQCWDEASARRCARIFAEAGFDGIAIGGMVPRARDKEYVKSIVRVVREAAPNCVIHVFGCGNMDLIPELIAAGADSFDSSSYARRAVDSGKTESSSGMHSAMYTAIENLYKTNAMLGGEDKINEVTPNMKLCR